MDLDRRKEYLYVTTAELIQVVLKKVKRKKQKSQKWERKKLQLSQDTFTLLF